MHANQITLTRFATVLLPASNPSNCSICDRLSFWNVVEIPIHWQIAYHTPGKKKMRYRFFTPTPSNTLQISMPQIETSLVAILFWNNFHTRRDLGRNRLMPSLWPQWMSHSKLKTKDPYKPLKKYALYIPKTISTHLVNSRKTNTSIHKHE